MILPKVSKNILGHDNGPTPSKRKDIVLEQEVVKGFEFVLHRKKEKIL
jgi:hypothetical protein